MTVPIVLSLSSPRSFSPALKFLFLLKLPFPTRQLLISRTMTTSRQQPSWQLPAEPPADTKLPPVRIFNSLTRRLDSFVPIDSRDRKVTWYACGPTVYDDAHLGHARNYVSTDIIRRVMRDYFKYNVRFVMNITDVDDKVRVLLLLLRNSLSGRDLGSEYMFITGEYNF